VTPPPSTQVARARVLICAVLLVDALLACAIGFAEAKPNPTAPFHLAPLLWGIALGIPFGWAALVLYNGDGIERSGFARVLAWTTGFGLPFLMFVITAMAWGSAPERNRWEPVWYLFAFGLFQMLIPTAVRWARDEGAFLGLLGRTATTLLVACVVLLGLVYFV